MIGHMDVFVASLLAVGALTEMQVMAYAIGQSIDQEHMQTVDETVLRPSFLANPSFRARIELGAFEMPLTGEDAERHAAQSLREWIIEQQRLRRKELLSRWEQVLTTLAARSEEQEGGMDSQAVAVRDRSTVRQSKQVRSSRRRRCHPRGPRQGAMRKGHKRF